MKSLSLFIILAIFPFLANAQSGCIRVDSIAKWEVLDHSKAIVYDSQNNSITAGIFPAPWGVPSLDSGNPIHRPLGR